MPFSKLPAVFIASFISFFGGVIFVEETQTWPTSTAAIATEEAKRQYLLNAKDKCECGGKTID